MSMLLNDLCLRRSSLVKELVQRWQLEHEEAMAARDVEELVQEYLDLCRLLVRGWQGLYQRLFSDLEDIDAAGERMLTAITQTLDVCGPIGDLIAKTKAAGYQIHGSEEFAKQVENLKALRAEVIKTWPTVDHKMIEESMAAYGRGEYRLAEDMIHELENGRSAGH